MIPIFFYCKIFTKVSAMKKRIILFSAIISSLILFYYGFPAYAVDVHKITDQINTQIQVQDNGWIKILNHYVESETYEEWYREMGFGNPLEKDNDKVIRQLYVFVQFLKPCIATKNQSAFEEKEDMYFDEISAEFREETQYDDYMFYKFKCDYRNKVFVTFFTKEGVGIETRGEYPVAKLIAPGNEWYKLNPQTYQTNMFPGEKTSITFFQIPENAAHWYVWLSN
jgi:hypothetical protein